MDRVENMKKISNVKQFELLVKLMKENPEVAGGFSGFSSSKMEYGRASKEFAQPLNHLEPPLIDGDGYRSKGLE